MRPRLISFDLDHTLWNPDRALVLGERDSYQLACELSPAFAQAYSGEQFVQLRQQLMAELKEQAHRVSWLRLEAFRRAFAKAGHSAVEAEQFAEQAFAAFHRARQLVEIDPAAVPLLETLNREYTVGAISNGNACVKQVGLGEHFAFHYKGEDFPRAKPWPEMFVAAQRQTGIALSHCVHIGDHARDDVWAARAAGAIAVWFNPQYQPWPTEYGVQPLMVHTLAEIPALLQSLTV